MKMKYFIGFFSGVFLLACILGIGYQLSYKYVMDRQEARNQTISEQQEESISTKGTAEKNEGYYICVLHEYLVVYLSDKSTIFEVTNIMLSDLPEELQQEVTDGKYISTEEELYGFLENYSS